VNAGAPWALATLPTLCVDAVAPPAAGTTEDRKIDEQYNATQQS
jgi:hypothetical protein